MDEIRDHCFAGALVGAIASLFRVKSDGKGIIFGFLVVPYYQALGVFLFNVTVAYLFSPLACDVLLPRLSIDKTQNSCIALSGAIALSTSWAFLEILPLLSIKLKETIKALSPKMILERILRLWDEPKDKP